MGVNPADTARNRAMFGESVIKSVARHREVGLLWVGASQKAANYFIGFASIKIVSVNGGERLGKRFSRAPNRMGRSPRLLSIWRDRKSSRQKIKLLEDVIHGHIALVARAHSFPKFFLDVSSYNKHDALKTSPHSVEDRVIEKSFT